VDSLTIDRIGMVGTGRLAVGLGGALLAREEVSSVLYLGRRPTPPDHPLFEEERVEYRYGLLLPHSPLPILLLAIPDDALGEVVQGLASQVLASQARPGGVGGAVLHLSGALGLDPLRPLAELGFDVGSLHPMESVPPGPIRADRFEGTSFAISGDQGGLHAARLLVRALGGHPLSVPSGERPRYHAAAVLASNYLVTLLHRAGELLREAGIPGEEADRALLHLARGTIERVGELGTEGAMTGPLVRGDAETIGLHLRALDYQTRLLYALLGQHSLEVFGERLEEGDREALAVLLMRV